MAILFLLFLFAVAIVQLLWRWLTNYRPKEPKNKNKPRDRQKPFNLLDFDEFADIMDEDDEEGKK